ncbi:MBL fold metallo-hydrolase [Nocardioides donggukensis]|uniref:MBL fold metallo-hydrolase n=1 Tax=Nocardioides donggukensis TaxID=2774019 RepID=A0A927K6Q4_9ACTN|nr:MBL fold metallo-hydrolase [Nocardioides donggukensis]MBD8870023.1 MBL fold metallo-hydrolase [Nocardioides donggukensis]
MTAFREVSDRVWVARHTWFDLNIAVIAGTEGLLVVDTHASASAARAVLEQVRTLSPLPVAAVVNTHEHFDHTFGNGVIGAGVPVYAHETAAANTVPAGERAKRAYAAEPEDPHAGEVAETEIVPADRTFSSAVSLDLGERPVELVHPGLGHTAGDVVVRVPDADVLLAGDLVEESATPGFGPDCHPMEWPLTLDLVSALLTEDSVVVPGHGAVVDRDFALEQRAAIGGVAETIRDLAGRGVPVDAALASAEWPFPVEDLADAVRRGYQALPRSARSLPLL